MTYSFFDFFALGFVPGATKLLHHLVEGGEADAGQALEAAIAAQAVGRKRVVHGAVPFAKKEPYQLYVDVVWESPF